MDFYKDCHPGDEIFTWEDPDKGTFLNFNIMAMYKFAMDNEHIERVKCPIEASHAEFVLKNHGLEQPRLDRLKAPYIDIPILIVTHDDGTHTVIDGNHRFVKRHHLGLTDINAFIFKLGEWEPFLVTNMPDELARRMIDDARDHPYAKETMQHG